MTHPAHATLQSATAPHRTALTGVLVVAGLARIAIALYAERDPARFEYPDSHRYARVAANLAAGRGLMDTPDDRTGNDPIYPLLLAPAWRLGGATVQTVFRWGRIVNAAFGLLLVACVFELARRWFGRPAALAAGFIAALDPILVFFHGLPLTEVAYTALLWAAALLLAGSSARGHAARLIVAGVLLGLSVLTRSSGLPIALALPLAAIFADRGSAPLRTKMGRAIIVWAALACVLLPMAIRNRQLVGRFSPLRTGGGATLLESLNPSADGGPGMEKVAWPPTPPGTSEAERDRVCRDAAMNWAREHPAEVARLALRKLARTWSITINAPGYGSAWARAVCWLTVAPVFAFALVGAWRHRHARGRLLLLLTPALCITLLHMIYVGSVRYRIPAMPGLYVLCGAALIRPASRDATQSAAESHPA